MKQFATSIGFCAVVFTALSSGSGCGCGNDGSQHIADSAVDAGQGEGASGSSGSAGEVATGDVGESNGAGRAGGSGGIGGIGGTSGAGSVRVAGFGLSC